MLNNKVINELVRMAGPGYEWPVSGTSRLSSDPRAGLRLWLAQVQNGICAFCSEELTNGFDLCHIVSGGPNRKGWVEGNLAAGCRECNELDGANTTVVSLETIVRPDLIPLEWPPIPILARLGKEEKREAQYRKEKKARLRGM